MHTDLRQAGADRRSPQTLMSSIEADFWEEPVKIEAESIYWIPIDEAAYLHTFTDS